MSTSGAKLQVTESIGRAMKSIRLQLGIRRHVFDADISNARSSSLQPPEPPWDTRWELLSSGSWTMQEQLLDMRFGGGVEIGEVIEPNDFFLTFHWHDDPLSDRQLWPRIFESPAAWRQESTYRVVEYD